ncbi:MAG: beta-galactosidase [Clostridia bacterium]|nr:beta-galactosidase [Clostridia bacterium]
MNIPRNEYPRPRFVREKWQNLNGEWDFAFDFGNSGKYRKFWLRDNYPFDRKIVVPFVPESPLSGIEYIDFFQTCWYHRTFRVTESFSAECERVLLHVGAADYISEVWVNEQYVGSHTGGYTPFTFDITEFTKSGDENDLVIRCNDVGFDKLQPTGKQMYRNYYNKDCEYTRCTGIWQTVWLEYVPKNYIESFKLTPDVDNEKLDVTVKLAHFTAKGDTVTASASFKGETCAEVTAKTCGRSCTFSIPVKDAKLWSIEEPNLYDLELTFGEDKATTYFGMRKVAVNGKAIEINDRPVFQRLVLDQGYYPDGIYTAPTVQDIEKDIIMSKNAGFNGARLHMKIFEPYEFYYADHMGYILWGEFPNWGLDESDTGALDAMIPDWLASVERDYNSPSVVGWCPFNETRRTRREQLFKNIYTITKAIDPVRPFIDSSGYFHTRYTDVYDVHDYDQNPETFRARHLPLATGEGKVFVNNPDDEKYLGQPYMISEMGGIYWNLDEYHGGGVGGSDNWAAWGYGENPKSLEAFYERFEGLMSAMLSNPGLCGFCYTQLTDVYQEKNGIYAFDRREKFDMDRIRAAVSRKAAIEK